MRKRAFHEASFIKKILLDKTFRLGLFTRLCLFRTCLRLHRTAHFALKMWAKGAFRLVQLAENGKFAAPVTPPQTAPEARRRAERLRT